MPSPLAARILRERTLLKNERTFPDATGILRDLPNAKCFEVSDIGELADQLQRQYFIENPGTSIAAFLPATWTWLEWKRPGTAQRKGWLLHAEDLKRGTARAAIAMDDGVWGTYPDRFEFDWSGDTPASWLVSGVQRDSSDKLAQYLYKIIPTLLCLINAPKVARHVFRQADPRTARALGLPKARWPLLGWSEIKIDIDREYREAVHGGELSGQRPLHFVRAYLRLLRGTVVLVRPHWRGDAALGIVQSRYKTVASKHGETVHA